MNNLQIFSNPEFGSVRAVEINNIPHFVASDVAKILGYVRPNDAISQHIDNEDTAKYRISDNQGIPHEYIIINESGVYSLVFGSKLPTAKKFKKWVTSEVLPSIRKSGGYIATNSEDTPELIMARALQVANDTLERHKLQLQHANSVIKEQAPKVQYYDDVMDSKGLLTINTIANDLGISAIKLNRILCEKNIQYRQNNTYVLYSKYRNMGLVQHIPHPYMDRNGEMKTTQHMYWTEAGKKFILEVIKVESGVSWK